MRKLVTLILIVFALPAWAERASLSELSTYINSIKSAEARFQQVNADGSRSRGTLFLKRPGNARFEYDPPDDEALVLASGGQVAIFDGRASGRPEQFPLRQTPLNLILARKVDLTKASVITGIGTHRGHTIIEAQDREHPEYGKIRLYFEQDPLRLAEWLIIGQGGDETRVVLEPFTPRKFKPSTFDITLETSRR